MKDSTKKWTDKEFLKIRKEEVLPQWHTGKEIEDLDAQVEYQKKLPPLKHWATAHDAAVENNEFRFSCMTGVATEQQMLDNMLPLEDIKHDWMVHLDTYSRAHLLDKADEAIARSTKEGRSVLNGYPVINHSLQTTRKITESVKGACVFNNSDTDQRLAAEMAIAGGFSGVLAHTLHDLAQHTKTFPLDEKQYYAQYISRLCAYYNERGVPITCELPGDLSGWDMPAFRVAITVLDALLSARQGAKHIMLGMDIGLNLIQDIASCNMMYKMGRHYLDQEGFEDAKVRVQSFGWLGDFPRELPRATAIVAWNTITLIMANVRSQTVKSTDEGVAIATPAGNRAALLCAKQLAAVMGNAQMPATEELREEEEMQELEIRALIDKTLDLGKGDVGLGMIKAVDAGVLDTMFSPWRFLKQKVSFVRDNEGAIRYLDHGGLPLPQKVVDFHTRKIQEKEKIKGSKATLDWIVENIKLVSGSLEK